MPPKKRSLPVEYSSVKQNSKRRESPLETSKGQTNEDDENSTDKRVMDSYCWICHQPEKDIIGCKDCPRVYHTICLNDISESFEDDACPECRQKFLDLQNQKGFITVRTLREMLTVAAEAFLKKINKSPHKDFFLNWPNIDDSKLVKVMDFNIIQDNIIDYFKPYKTFGEVVGDIKWIHHNYCIVDGVCSSIAKEAETLVKSFQKDISDIEDCPMCYHRMFVGEQEDDFFEKICNPPHDIVWACLKGSSAWPAKCLNVENGKAHVRFFGTHDKANIPLKNNKCLAISLNHPKYKNSKLTDKNLTPKKKEYKEAVAELLQYVKNFEDNYGCKFKFYDVGTPYLPTARKPGEKMQCSENFNGCSTFENSEENATFESVFNESEETGNLRNRIQDIQVSMLEDDETGATSNLSHKVQGHQVSMLDEDKNGKVTAPLTTAEVSSNTEDLDEDDDVICLGEYKTPSPKDIDSSLALPSLTLPFLGHSNPELGRMLEQAHSTFNSVSVKIWANAGGLPQAPQLIHKLLEEQKQLSSEYQELRKNDEERRKSIIDNKILSQQVAKLIKENNSLKMRVTANKKKVLKLETDLISVTRNANDVVKGTVNVYSKEFKTKIETLTKKCKQNLEEQKALLTQKNKEVEKARQEIVEAKNELIQESQSADKLRSTSHELEIKLADVNARNEVYSSLLQKGLLEKKVSEPEALQRKLHEICCKSDKTETSEPRSSKESVANLKQNHQATFSLNLENSESSSSSNSEAEQLMQTAPDGPVSPLSSMGSPQLSTYQLNELEKIKNILKKTEEELIIQKRDTKDTMIMLNESEKNELEKIKNILKQTEEELIIQKRDTKDTMIMLNESEQPNIMTTSEKSNDSSSSTSEADYSKQTSHKSSVSPLSDEQLSLQLLTDQFQVDTIGIPQPTYNVIHPFLNVNPSTLGYSTHQTHSPQMNEGLHGVKNIHQVEISHQEVVQIDHQEEVQIDHEEEVQIDHQEELEMDFQGVQHMLTEEGIREYCQSMEIDEQLMLQQQVCVQDEENYVRSQKSSRQKNVYLPVNPSTLDPEPFFGLAEGPQRFEIFEEDDL